MNYLNLIRFHSLNAIHNGGFFGQGIALGDIKVGFLSEVHTDFVLAGITEEIGLVGLFIICTLILVLFGEFLKLVEGWKSNISFIYIRYCFDDYYCILINSLWNFRNDTNKGIAVPFLSYGGSSMLAMAVSVGLVLSISRVVKEEDVKKKG